MSHFHGRFTRFWQELRRRKVLKAFIWYAGVAMVLIGLASDVAGPFHLPDGTLRLVIILIIVGFPLAMIFSWIFDFTPEGLQRSPSRIDDQGGKRDLGSSPPSIRPTTDPLLFCPSRT